MNLSLEKISPDYLSDRAVEASEIWGHSLVLTEGQSTMIWGPSGAGKSTLLRILYGIEKKYSGSLLYGSENAFRLSPTEMAKLRATKLAFVSQDFQLFETESGWTNLAYAPYREKNVTSETLSSWAGELGIATLLDRPPETWSQGQRQRVAILRALATPFRWIFLDEPVSHLDPASAESALKLVQRVCNERGAGWLLAQQTADNQSGAENVYRI